MDRRFVSVLIKIKEFDSPNNMITLPSSVYNQINRYFAVKLKAGASEFEVECYPNDTRVEMEISGEFVKELSLVPGRAVNLFVRNNMIFLGPFIGIFISNGQIKKAMAQNPVFRFAETARANREAKAVIYYFSINDVDFDKKRIIGTWFNEETEQWEKRSFPYPDVLYDRGGGTLESQQIISNNIREDLKKDRELKQVNPKYLFDKWEVHSNIIRYEEMGVYLPETILFTRKEDLVQMLERYPLIYIKDTLGNNGKGVARVKKLSEKNYEISYFSGSYFKINLDSLDDLYSRIKDIFNDKKIILQSAIDLLQINNRNVDMRATVQRNGNGELSITALPVGMGKEDYPITTTRSGASVYKFEDFFKKYFNYSEQEISDLRGRISYFLMRCFIVIEDIYGPFGEIGIDYAIDKSGRIWFIECNAKPGKDTLYLSYDDNTIKKAFLNPLEYSKYIWRNF